MGQHCYTINDPTDETRIRDIANPMKPIRLRHRAVVTRSAVTIHDGRMTLQWRNVITLSLLSLSLSVSGNARSSKTNPQVTKPSVCLKLLRGVLTTIIVK